MDFVAELERQIDKLNEIIDTLELGKHRSLTVNVQRDTLKQCLELYRRCKE